VFKKKTHFIAFQLVSVAAFLMIFIFGFSSAPDQSNHLNLSGKMKPLASKINALKNSGKNFSTKQILSIDNNRQSTAKLSSYLKNYTMLTLDEQARNSLIRSKDENITFRIPLTENEFMDLELTKESVVTENFKAGTLSGNGTVSYINYTPGLYYRGIIKGDNESFASLSIFNDFVMAVISNSKGNWNLSSLKGENSMYSENYVFYNDADLTVHKDFTCGVNDDSPLFDKRSHEWNNGSSNSANPPQLVKQYFECDFTMYQDFGSNVTNVNNYVTAFYNVCIALYQQDSINTSIQEIFVWTTPDVYQSLTDNLLILYLFGDRQQNSFNGDLAHWLSTRTDISGGIAWIGVLCRTYNPVNHAGPYAVSVLGNDTAYFPFPQYSWTVEVVSHEMGHNLGSKHTHNCSWPGGPIDSCYTVEGGCYGGPPIPRVGTVMSYCHLNATINFSLGFGPLPGDTIRARVRNAPCLTIGISQIGTEIPSGYELSQNYPNPFNPVTNIQFSIPKTGNVKLLVYDAAGKEISALVNEQLLPGIYKVDFDAADYSSGVYFYKLVAEGLTVTKKMVLIK